MEGYLSIREAAEKWGVSQRRINQYCAEGRIPGAERFGGSWAIPENARKPGDPRREKKKAGPAVPPKAPELFHGFMPLMNTPFRPGHCMEAIEGMKAGPTRDIALAEYHCFSGQAEKALELGIPYVSALDGALERAEDRSEEILPEKELIPAMQTMLDKVGAACPGFAISNKISLNWDSEEYRNSPYFTSQHIVYHFCEYILSLFMKQNFFNNFTDKVIFLIDNI